MIGGEIKNSDFNGEIIVSNSKGLSVGGIAGRAVNAGISDNHNDGVIKLVRTEEFSELKRVLNENIKDSKDVREIVDLVKQLEQNKNTKDYRQVYMNFISRVSEYMNIIKPFLSLLEKFL